MLKHTLLHPEISQVLARAGHSSQVLIADGNYPASHTLGPKAELVSLNLAPGIVSCCDVLRALVSAIPIEAANTMGIPESDPLSKSGEPPIWGNFRQILKEAGVDAPLESISRWDFYEAASSPRHVLTIQTADQALYANLLLTIGVRK